MAMPWGGRVEERVFTGDEEPVKRGRFCKIADRVIQLLIKQPEHHNRNDIQTYVFSVLVL